MDTEFEWISLFGYIATVLCIASFLFQMYKIYINKSATDVSHGFIILQLIVNIFYTIYNSYSLNIPLLINNGTLTILILIMCCQKYYYGTYVIRTIEIIGGQDDQNEQIEIIKPIETSEIIETDEMAEITESDIPIDTTILINSDIPIDTTVLIDSDIPP